MIDVLPAAEVPQDVDRKPSSTEGDLNIKMEDTLERRVSPSGTKQSKWNKSDPTNTATSTQNPGLYPEDFNEQTTTINERPVLPSPNNTSTTLKREKSHTDSIERKKKRVKFNSSVEDGCEEVTVRTHVFQEVDPYEALIRDSDIVSNTPLANKLKRMLRCKSKQSDNAQNLLGVEQARDQNRNVEEDQSEPSDEHEKQKESSKRNSQISLDDGSEFSFIDDDIDILNDDECVETRTDQDSSEFNTKDSSDDVGSLKREGSFLGCDDPPAKALKLAESVIVNHEKTTNLHLESPEPETCLEFTKDEDDYKYFEKLVSKPKSALNNKYDLGDSEQFDERGNREAMTSAKQPKTIELKLNSTAAKRRAKVNVEKSPSLKNLSNDDADRTDRKKSVSIRDSAKQTLINAWKSAMKSSTINANENLSDNAKSNEEIRDSFHKNTKICGKKTGKTEIGKNNKKPTQSSNLHEKSPELGGKSTRSFELRCRSPRSKQTATPSEESGLNDGQRNGNSTKLVGTVLPFRRDGTFTKKTRQMLDNEKYKLEAEIRRLSSDNTRLQSEVSDLRIWVEGEESARKAMRREHLQRIRQLKEEDAKKRELALAELRNRLEEDHKEALTQQRTSLRKETESQLQKLERELQEELRRVKQENRSELDRVRAECRRECSRCAGVDGSRTGGVHGSPTTTARLAAIKEQQDKANTELCSLRATKSQLEETITRLHESERDRLAELKRLQAVHETAAATAARTARLEQTKMMEELRAKDRRVNSLERQLSQLTSTLQARSNSSPGTHPSKLPNRNKGKAKEHPTEAEAMDSSGSEVSRLREEVEQQKRTIRQLSLKIPHQYRDDHQPMSLGTIPSVSMDSVYDGIIRPLFSRTRQDSQSSNELTTLVAELKEENRNLKSELQEARDQADLLEFRILELTEGSDRSSESDEVNSIREVEIAAPSRKQQSRQTKAASVTAAPTQGSCEDTPAPAQPHEDLSLPLSIDSGLDLTADCKKGRLSAQVSPSSRVTIVTSPSTPMEGSNTAVENTEIPSLKTDSPVEAETMLPEDKSLKSSDLTELAARLQECLATPQLQEEAILEAINKLRELDSCLNSLHSKVHSLSEENQYLQDAVSALSDAHETRTEASGTESEIVNNRKTPTLHSDLSDSESDSASSSSTSSRPTSKDLSNPNKHPRLEVTTSFQESGIFEGPCEVQHSATQTECSESSMRVFSAECGEEDLSSAVARLASIRTVVQGGSVHVRSQDGDDSTSKVLLAAEEEQFSSRMLEIYELKSQLEIVRKEKDDLQSAFNTLQESIGEETKSFSSCRRCLESSEVDRGEANVLREQLSVCESARRNLYEEKCELEEAENDARLMVQRLDSQLTASREMECLLSASLSQEQEISRELHRKVKELQAVEKERSLRQGILERQSLNSVERMASLVMDRDSHASLLSFIRNGLILAQVYRLFCSSNPGAIVPYSIPKKKSLDSNAQQCSVVNEKQCFSAPDNRATPCGMVDCALDEALMDIGVDEHVRCRSVSVNSVSDIEFSSTFSLDPVMDLTESTSLVPDDFLVPGLCDTGCQTDPVTFLDESSTSCQVYSYGCEVAQTKEVPVMSNVSTVSNVTFIDVLTSPVIPTVVENTQKIEVCRPPVEMKTKSTMTVEKDLLSQRENYYLEQIETLQEEKMNLRKDHEREKLDSLRQCEALESSLENVQQQLSDSEASYAILQCQLEEARGQRETSCRDLQRRMEEMRGDMARCSDLHEMEKKALRRDFDARLSEVSEERRRSIERVSELEQQLSALRKELEVVGVAIVSDMTSGYDGEPSAPARATMDGNSAAPSSVGISSASELLDKIRKLIKSESSLRHKITELEKKETAYRVTIDEADKIMHSHMRSYTQRIEELEALNEQYLERIKVMERNEDRLRSSFKSSARSDQDSRVSDLLQQLINVEKSELECKAKIWNLEKNEKQLQIKLMECEKAQQNLRSELRDQEELVQKMTALQNENTSLSQELNKAHDGVRRICEMQQSEHYLKGRVEELEISEQALREALDHSQAYIMQRERKLMDQVSKLEEEVHTFKSQLEAASLRDTEARETETNLRKQLEQVRARLEESERDLKETSSETINYETQHRSEVCKLRSQLNLVNSQMNELEGISCTLRERLAASEQVRESLESQLEERKRRHESDLLQLNLQVSQRESRLEETEGQLCELTQLHAAQELDMLASSSLSPVISSAHALATQLQLCEACSASQGATLEDFRTHLKTLSDLLQGSTLTDAEDNGDESEEEEAEDASKPQECVSLDVSTGSSSLTDESSPSCSSLPQPLIPSSINQPITPSSSSTLTSLSEGCPSSIGQQSSSSSPRNGSPVPVPAPRRKRKQRREDMSALRGSLRGRKRGGSTTILEELEEKVRELEESTAKKEEELKLADIEAADLSLRLQKTQEHAASKDAEISEVRKALTALQEQLVIAFEAHEFTKISLESRYKSEEISTMARLQGVTEQLERLAEKGRLKDHIIATLVTQIRAILRTTSMGVVVTQIRQLGSRLELQQQRRLQDNDSVVEENSAPADFDIESVCDMLGQPREMYSELAAMIDETIEVLLQESCLCLRCHKQLPTPPPSPSSASFTSSSSSSHQDESRDGFPPSQYNLLSSSTTALNQTVDQWTQTNVSVPLVPSASTNRSRIPKLVTPKPSVNNPTTSRASKTAASETSNVITPQSSRHTVNRSAPLSRSASTPVVTAQRPKSVNLQQKSRRYLTSTPLHATPHLKPFHTSTPVNSPQMCSPSTTPKPNLSSSLHQSLVTSLHHSSKVSSRSTARKEQTRPKTSQSQAADARCIKRMLTGIASPSAPVECFASPELQEKKSTQNDTILNTTFDANNSSIIDVTNIEITNQSGDNEENESSSLNTTFTRSFSSRSTNDLSRKAVQATMSLNRSSSAASTILPKWRPAGTSTSPNSLPTMNSTICKNSEGTGCIPKPADLRVTRRVGVDGAVLAWSPLDHDCVLGFQVVVQGRVVQHVKSPHRTKALITGLPASNSYTIGLISVGVDGRCSTPAVVKCDRTTVYPGKNQKKTPLVRKLATPTCI